MAVKGTKRTTLYLSNKLYNWIQKERKTNGFNVSAFVQQQLEKHIYETDPEFLKHELSEIQQEYDSKIKQYTQLIQQAEKRQKKQQQQKKHVSKREELIV
jgi:Arc/MetJ-type ribon-helix-helix transcriptional regulator